MASYRFPPSLCTPWSEDIDEGTLCRSRSPLPGTLGFLPPLTACLFYDESDYPWFAPDDRVAASAMSFGNEGATLLKGVESLHLQPYDDQTGKDIKDWVQGATIGYGHLIAKADWKTYKDGITETEANTLFNDDLSPFVSTVQKSITARLHQNEFDALVILAFNIGKSGFASSSVVTLVNDPTAKTSFKDLEAAWKAWNKSQGKVMKGLDNRRNAEWKIYSQGVYERW